MKTFIIKGPSRGLKGIINISGAKNSCLTLMAASILFKKRVLLKNVPFVKDVITMKNLLIALGSKVEMSERKKTIKIVNNKKHKLVVPYKLVSTMRAGVLTMGPLLGRYQKQNIYVAKSGGCSLGVRDINFHLSGFESLGAKNKIIRGYVNISSKKGLSGSSYRFPKVTVTGTSNLIMAAVLAKGKHILKNISIEPEVIDLINFLVSAGAKIKFIGKRTIKIIGIKQFTIGQHKIISDRIEAFSYLSVGAITKKTITVHNINPKFLNTEINILRKIGYEINTYESKIQLKTKNKLKPVKVKTGPFPAFATDNMPMLLSILTLVPGKSEINETIFSNRFMAAPELSRMGANIKIKKNKAVIIGQKKLYSADCISSDLRTTFAIILGAIAGHGTSQVHRVYHGLRGYYNLKSKLKTLGVNIRSVG